MQTEAEKYHKLKSLFILQNTYLKQVKNSPGRVSIILHEQPAVVDRS